MSFGWVCPRCNNVYAPHMQECWRCNGGSMVPAMVDPVLPPLITNTAQVIKLHNWVIDETTSEKLG